MEKEVQSDLSIPPPHPERERERERERDRQTERERMILLFHKVSTQHNAGNYSADGGADSLVWC